MLDSQRDSVHNRLRTTIGRGELVNLSVGMPDGYWPISRVQKPQMRVLWTHWIVGLESPTILCS